jgi:sirohydrochlorin cobaltochelatase
MDKPPKRALVFLAHGSRDPAWKLPIEAIASRAGQLAPVLMTRCAYLEMTQPDLESCVRELAASAVTQISVVPVFLGMGQHVRTDLPRLLTGVRSLFPGIAVSMQNAVGDNAEVLDLIGKIAVDKEARS